MKIKKSEFRKLLEAAFEAGAKSENDAYWLGEWEGFPNWYKRVVKNK